MRSRLISNLCLVCERVCVSVCVYLCMHARMSAPRSSSPQNPSECNPLSVYVYVCMIHTYVHIHTHVRTVLKFSANPSECNPLSVKMTTLSVYMRALSLSKILKSQYPSIFTLYRDHMLTFENLWTSQCHTAPCLCEQKQN
jgi:hypothetical protein